ncbi:MAG: TRAP transporter large permease subunit [Myxococcales bacterium]|nr:TRAP transporter large permease subunit [Myxococcota bacterium]MDW8284324.1 TRAP transporter large permease subunit [Myxococcales bacterium]
MSRPGLSPTDFGEQEGPPPGTRLEALLVSLLALGMMLLPVAQIIARAGFGKDIPGSSLYVQHATLWIGFLGALLATAGGRHLGLSTANFMPHGRLRSIAEWTSAVMFAIVTALLAYASARLVSSDRAGSKDTLPGGVPSWWTEIIMPVGFAFMSVRVIGRATERKRPRLRIGLRALALVVAVLALYLGLRHDSSPAIEAALRRLDALRQPVLWVGSLLVLMAFLMGTPVFVAMAGVAMVLFFSSGTPIAAVPGEIFRLVVNPALPAIPLLTIAGYIMAAGNASQRLVRAYKSLFGWMPGGLSIMVVASCALFTTFTGASGVTILALGGLVLPMLLQDRYPEGFSLGLVTAAGSLGLLFPPSLPVILYGVAASSPGAAAPVSVDQLFIGGLIPGLLMVVLVCLYGIHRGVVARAPRQPFRWGEVLHALWDAKWDLLLPLLVIGAFASGMATVVEAAALGVTYALLVELFVYRDVHPIRELPGVLVHATTLVGAVVVLLGVALGLTSYLVQEEIPTRIVEWVQGHIHSQWLFLLALNIILLVLGSVLEIYSAIVVLVPLVAPLGVAFGVHPVHLGVIFLANLELGFLCPPMGLNLFLSATRFQKPLPVLYRQALPFLLIMGIGVLIITYFEGATTGLLMLVGKL